ncbi:ABC transporter ATP-binding protein [Mesorhizobium sp.]|jgi:ABC-type Fe3+/spermidine/putrescine transport system ATPase subunit|uniref:ABC transporter ATP-binding protein n=1 Tax=Mesorhizobium sp. TaxID=1871066 RepID=UPI00356AF654
MNRGISSETPLIEMSNGQKKFGLFQALTNIDLTINEGEIVTLLGPSGCGKTTLMRIIAGFEALSSGSLKIDGKDVAALPPEKRPVNMVFQRYALFPHLDVFDNVAYGLKVKGVAREERRSRVQAMLKTVQMESLAHRFIGELSGGQCQRVALARALVNGPRVLLLDEPLAALDLKIRQHMLAEMKRIQMETGATFVYVTHDQDEAMILSDRVVLIDRGRIVQVDKPQDMYFRPRTLFAAKFLGETNLFEGKAGASSDGQILLQTPDGPFDITAGAVPMGGAHTAVMSVRPEAMSFRRCASQDDHELEAEIDDVIFSGSRSFFHLVSRGGQKFRVQVQNLPGAELPGTGDMVHVCWRKDSAIILQP